MIKITHPETVAIVQAWKSRAQAQGYKKGTKTYAKLEVEFFVGAIATLLALRRVHPPIWELLIRSGRSISETLIPDEVNPLTERSEGSGSKGG